VPRLEIAFLSPASRSSCEEIFYDTKDGFLFHRFEPLFLKKVISSDGEESFHLKLVKEFNAAQERLFYIPYVFPSLEEAVGYLNTLFPSLSCSERKTLQCCDLVEQVTFLLQRCTLDVSNLCLTYDQVEFPKGDLYTVCSATSTEPLSSEGFLQQIKAVTKGVTLYPAHSRYSEWFRRYHPAEFEAECAKGTFSNHSQPSFEIIRAWIGDLHPKSRGNENLYESLRLQLGFTEEQMQRTQDYSYPCHDDSDSSDSDLLPVD